MQKNDKPYLNVSPVRTYSSATHRPAPLFLSISRARSVFAHVMVLAHVFRQTRRGSAQKYAAEGEPGDVLQNVGVLHGIHGRLAPGERRMSGHQHTGHRKGVQVLAPE